MNATSSFLPLRNHFFAFSLKFLFPLWLGLILLNDLRGWTPSSESEMPEGMEGGEEKRMEEKSQLPFRTVLLKDVMSVMSILASSWEALISDKNIVSASVFLRGHMQCLTSNQ